MALKVIASESKINQIYAQEAVNTLMLDNKKYEENDDLSNAPKKLENNSVCIFNKNTSEVNDKNDNSKELEEIFITIPANEVILSVSKLNIDYGKENKNEVVRTKVSPLQIFINGSLCRKLFQNDDEPREKKLYELLKVNEVKFKETNLLMIEEPSRDIKSDKCEAEGKTPSSPGILCNEQFACSSSENKQEIIQKQFVNFRNNTNSSSLNPNTSILDARKKVLTQENSTNQLSYIYNYEFSGFVMKINSLKSFYVQHKKADILLMQMKEHLEKCIERLHKKTTEGTLCVARDYVDNQLLRAQIIKIDKGRARIHFIDYGNTACVNFFDLFKMSPELKLIPPLSLHCSLNEVGNDLNLAKSVEMIEKFKLLTSKSSVFVKILRPTPAIRLLGTYFAPFEIDLFFNQNNIQHPLSTQPSSLITTSDIKALSSNSRCETNDFFYGKVVKISSLNNVLVQRKSKLDKIQRVINEYNNMTCVEMDCDDEYCLAPSSNGGDEYLRARVIEKNGDKYKLNYIDYGFEETVNKRDLLKASDIITEISPAIEEYKMHLVTNLDLITETSTAYIIKLFKLFVDSGENEYKICVCGKNQNKKTIRLYDINARNLCLNNLLETSIVLLVTPFFGTVNSIEEDFKKFVCVHTVCSSRSALVELEKLFQKFLIKKLSARESLQTNFESNEPIYSNKELCLVYNEEILNASLRSIKNILSNGVLSKNSIASVASQPDLYKQSIYRAIVLGYDSNNDKYEFFNVDNGSIDFIKRKHAFKLDHELISDRAVMQIPFMAIIAQLNGDDCLSKTILNLRYFRYNIKLNIVKSIDSLNKIVSVIKDEPKPIQTELDWYDVSLFESFDSFYMHSSQTRHNLLFIEDRCKLASSFANKPTNKPLLNTCIYGYKFSTIIKRVIVLRLIENSKCEVLLIDFGKKEIIKTDQLVIITDEALKNLKPQAIWCKLHNSEKMPNKKQIEIEFKRRFEMKRFKVNFVKEQPNILTQAIVELLTSDSDDSYELINLKD